MLRNGLLFLVALMLFVAPLWGVASEHDGSTSGEALQGATSCDCFCKSDAGAQDLGSLPGKSACDLACDTRGFTMLGCYRDEGLHPENNDLCWSEAECISATQVEDFEERESEWGGQEPVCSPGKGYCYTAVDPIRLGVNIGELSETTGFAQYISALYAFLIPAASILAVVMIMIGGLQYMLARGNAPAIEKAKARMRNAVIGLVLLLGAYTIAYFIDPNLTGFNELRLPQVRTVTFLDPGSSCEALMENGVDVVRTAKGATSEEAETLGETITEIASGGLCGDTGVVEGFGEDRVVGWEIGDECKFIRCLEEAEQCLRVSESEGADTFQCASCRDVGPGSDIEASSSVCRALTQQPTQEQLEEDKHFYCEYNAAIGSGQCLDVSYPQNDIGLDCEVLRQDAQVANSLSCRVYDTVGLRPGGLGQDLLDELEKFMGQETSAGSFNLDTLTTKESAIGPWFFHVLKKVCSEDPCGLAPTGQSCTLLDYGGSAETLTEKIAAAATPGTLSAWPMDCVNSAYYDAALEASLSVDLPLIGPVTGYRYEDIDTLPEAGVFRNAFIQFESIIGADDEPVEFNPLW